MNTETRKKATGTSGFTLVEVLLVVAIIGILAAVVVSNFGNQGIKARIQATRASIATIATAIDVYQVDTGRYPASLDNLLTSSGEPNWNGPYTRGGMEALKDAWGSPFTYTSTDAGYKIISAGPDSSVGTPDDITSF